MSHDLWGRFRYALSPQFDIYEAVSEMVRGKVADIGSGTGVGSNLLARNADQVYGFDIEPNAVKFARRVFSRDNLAFFDGDITNGLNYTNTRTFMNFDFVTMIDVIEHIEDHYVAIKKVKALLNGSGVLICSTPNRLSRYRQGDYHVREYSPDDLKGVLGAVFESVDLMDFQLKPIESEFSNPIIAICT